MKFAIALYSAAHARPPRAAPCCSHRRRWLAGMRSCGCFFHQDACTASNNIVAPQDEQDLARQWREFVSQHQLDGVVCIAAALRRGA